MTFFFYISTNLKQRQSSATQMQKKHRQQLEAFHRKREAIIAAKNEQMIAQSVNKVLPHIFYLYLCIALKVLKGVITGHNISHMSVTNNPDYFKGFTNIENATRHPVSMKDKKFKTLGII